LRAPTFSPTTNVMPDPAVIDPQAIENLRALNPGDNDEFLREIAGIFLEDTPLRIAELDQSLAASDVGKFTRAAHSIKGSSANLGAMPLRLVAEKLEHQSRTGGLGNVTALVAELKLEFARAQAELSKLLKR
jgi:HPt (histidine-containing phosphotransfer) domain-containing protein